LKPVLKEAALDSQVRMSCNVPPKTDPQLIHNYTQTENQDVCMTLLDKKSTGTNTEGNFTSQEFQVADIAFRMDATSEDKWVAKAAIYSAVEQSLFCKFK